MYYFSSFFKCSEIMHQSVSPAGGVKVGVGCLWQHYHDEDQLRSRYLWIAGLICAGMICKRLSKLNYLMRLIWF